MKECIKELLSANVQTLIYGKSGWGKSQITYQAAEELGMHCEVLSLAGVAPEDFGIPTIRDGYYEYLPPKWAFGYYKSQKPFVLFLDEITQATVQTMHAIYPIVLNRTVGGLSLPNMRIIAASNHNHENPHLTNIMTPLLNRFAVKITLEEDVGQLIIDEFWEYISKKYPNSTPLIDILRQNIIATNPRAYENGINFLESNKNANKLTTHLVCREAFGDLAQVVMSSIAQELKITESHDNKRLMEAKFAYKNKVIRKNGVLTLRVANEDIIKAFELNEEEQDIVFA